MLSLSGSLKVFVALEVSDMRKGFKGLHAAITERLGEDPLRRAQRKGKIRRFRLQDRTGRCPAAFQNGFLDKTKS